MPTLHIPVAMLQLICHFDGIRGNSTQKEEKIILHNRGANAMKIQLFFPKDFKPYLEFNPTLGFIQGKGHFEIWAKLKPDRSIL